VIVVDLKRRLADTAEVESLARISVPVPGGPAVVEAINAADLPAVEILLGDGVPDERGQTLRPEDGEAYVLALLEAFRGSRLWAERVS
jgi:hypothetical protein